MNDERLTTLVIAYLDGRLEGEALAELEGYLQHRAARARYWSLVGMHEAIGKHFRNQVGQDLAEETRFEQGMAELLEHEQRVGAELALVELPEDQWQQAWRERTIAGQTSPRDAEAGQVDASAATDARPQKLLEIGPLCVTRRRRPAGTYRGFGGARLAWAAGIAAMLVMTVLLMQKPEHVGQPVVDVARVSDAVGAEWAVRDADGAVVDAGVGDGLVAGGVLEVQRGFVELEMANETRVIVEGPSEVELQREALVRMQRGRLVARTNGAAETFTVVTPTASITDLGTEFGVRVDENGHTETSVFEGLARVIGLGVESLPRVQVEAGHTAAARGEGEPTVRESDHALALMAYVRSMSDARRVHEGIRLHAFNDEDYVSRQTYVGRGGSTGRHAIEHGELFVEPGEGNSYGLFRQIPDGAMPVGSTWAVDVEADLPEDQRGVVTFTISDQSYQPGPDSASHERADARGLRLRHEMGSPRHDPFHVIVDDDRDDRVSGLDVSAGSGSVALVVHRESASRFAFYAGFYDTGELLEVDVVEHRALGAADELYLGFETFREQGGGPMRSHFTNFRELEDVELWAFHRRPGRGEDETPAT